MCFRILLVEPYEPSVSQVHDMVSIPDSKNFIQTNNALPKRYNHHVFTLEVASLTSQNRLTQCQVQLRSICNKFKVQFVFSTFF